MTATTATGSLTGIQNSIQLILKAHGLLQDCNPKFGGKTSHNELERGRRAHLRKHMEELKSRLNRIPTGTRLTTLVILRAAKDQIRSNRLRNAHLQRLEMRFMKEYGEALERNRHLAVDVEHMKVQLRRIRCSGSECSMATTLSDESELGASRKTVRFGKLVSFHEGKARVDSGYGSPESHLMEVGAGK